MNVQIKRMNKINDDSTLKAFVDVTINYITIKGFKVVQGKEGLFVSKPSELNKKDGKYYDIVRFENLSDKEEFDKVVLEYYEKN